jgi:hypothetical protein
MNLQQANNLLEDHKSSCIILKNNEIVFTSSNIGVKPLLLFLKEKINIGEYDQLVLIDKIIGKAALLLAVKCKIQRIYTPIISSLALDAAKHYNVKCQASKIVPYIINREGNGMCPIESSVVNILDLDEALLNIELAINRLMNTYN